MVIRPHILLVVLLLLIARSSGAQGGRANAHVREGDRHFQQMAYARAVDSYTAAAEMGAVNEHVTKRLAESHLRLGNTVEAERWYAVVVKFLNREARDLYNYAEALKSNQRYEEAEEWMDRYLAMVDTEGQARSNITGFARKYAQDKGRFTVKPVGINSSVVDFGTSWLGRDKVLFSSSRNPTFGIERKAAMNDQPFLDLFVADVLPNGDLGDPRLLDGAVNTKYHEGPATANATGDVIWFTRNSYFQGRSQRSRQGISRLGIYRAAAQNGESFGNVEQFLYNNSEVSMAHPGLSMDGQRLFFVSDMPGGFGGTDIYVCRMQDGKWGEPENLGPNINTAQNEAFPFSAADGVLYFSSNGHPGLGGMDIFAAKPAGSKGFSAPLNVGAPVNSSRDDIAFIIDPSSTRGYFTSNRPGGVGDDDIYSFVMHKPLEEEFLVTGTVVDDEYEIPVMAADVLLYTAEGTLLDTTVTDSQGKFAFPIERDKAYRLVARLKGRYDGESYFSTERVEQQQIITRDVHLVADAGIFMQGAVRHKDRLGFIEGMTVSVVNLSSFFSESQRTDQGGGFRFRLQNNEEFEVLFEKPGFFSQSIQVTTVGVKQGVIDLNEIRDLEFEPIQVGTPIPLRYVRWAGTSATLDKMAKLELDELVERLMVNPSVRIELAVHADARDEADQALKTTQKQADAMLAYLVGKAVPKDRLKAQGYGTTRPVNHCVPGVVCSEEEHAANRRTEYTVTGLEE